MIQNFIITIMEIQVLNNMCTSYDNISVVMICLIIASTERLIHVYAFI